MKKNVFVVGMTVMVLTFVLAFVGCSSAPFVYDATVPLEQSSTLIIKDCQVYKFNGATMSLKNWNAGVGEKTVIIPAGSHTFEVWSSASSNMGSKLSVGKVEMTYNFLPGKTYFLIAPIEGGYVKGQIRDITNLYLDFPSPDPSSPDASPIEGRWKFTADGKTTDELIFVKNEFARMINGTYIWRGFIENNGKIFTLPAWAYYAKGEWKIIPPATEGIKLTYNGTTLLWGKNEGKKVE